MRGQIGRPCKAMWEWEWEAEVGGRSGRPKWEAEVGGRSGRLKWEAEVGGRSGRPNSASHGLTDRTLTLSKADRLIRCAINP